MSTGYPTPFDRRVVCWACGFIQLERRGRTREFSVDISSYGPECQRAHNERVPRAGTQPFLPAAGCHRSSDDELPPRPDMPLDSVA